ncbi:hypothetical protein ANN_24769 [Periplaneta americana]|uniref:Uncharacterized protein n=1 Tax=Periplaneta americana TaxID=6978 RepID=A0ABQ8RZI5_PERAM|nr:hypothetical protein ANN_24769 [Periplaneta americana]
MKIRKQKIRQSPGMKHFITIKQEGKKTTVQKRILNMNVMEAYRHFKEENPRLKTGKSTFANLRPTHVRVMSEKDHAVCCCKYHENFQFLLDAFHVLGCNLPKVDIIVKDSVCLWIPSCCLGECNKCGDAEAFVSERVKNVDLNSTITYYQWNAESKKTAISCTVREANIALLEQL